MDWCQPTTKYNSLALPTAPYHGTRYELKLTQVFFWWLPIVASMGVSYLATSMLYTVRDIFAADEHNYNKQQHNPQESCTIVVPFEQTIL